MIIVNDKIAPITITVTKRIVDGLYIGDNKKIDVSKIDVGKEGIKFAYSTFRKVPEYFSFENVTDMSRMFYNCTSLTTIPNLDTNNVTNMDSMFRNCISLTTIPLMEYKGNCDNVMRNTGLAGNIGNISMPMVTTIRDGFEDCTNLEEVGDCDFSGAEDTYRIFAKCSALVKIGNINIQNSSNPDLLVHNCDALREIGDIRCDSYTGGTFRLIQTRITEPIKLGGFSGLGKSATRQIVLDLTYLRGLTEQSVINIANTIEPNTSSYAHQCRVYSSVLNSLSDETIALFTNKGWTIRN